MMNSPRYKDHPIFKADVFSNPLFLSFQQEVLLSTAAEKPAEALMKSVLPLVHQGLAQIQQLVISENNITRSMVRDRMKSQDEYQLHLLQDVLLPTANRLGVMEMVILFFSDGIVIY